MQAIIEKKYQAYQTLLDAQRREAAHVRKKREENAVAKQVRDLIVTYATQYQQFVHVKIAEIVTDCLQTIFGKYRFDIEFVSNRNKTEAHMYLWDMGLKLDLQDSIGGGVLDVVAFGLRIACLMLSRPQARKILILDEPFRFVSEGYQPNIKELLERLAEELEIQFIIVTHNTKLITGKVVRIE